MLLDAYYPYTTKMVQTYNYFCGKCLSFKTDKTKMLHSALKVCTARASVYQS